MTNKKGVKFEIENNEIYVDSDNNDNGNENDKDKECIIVTNLKKILKSICKFFKS